MATTFTIVAVGLVGAYRYVDNYWLYRGFPPPRDPGYVHAHGTAWPHVAVVARPAPGGTVYSAVFPGLRTGRYDLWLRPDEPTGMTVTVTGAQVTTVSWAAVAAILKEMVPLAEGLAR